MTIKTMIKVVQNVQAMTASRACLRGLLRLMAKNMMHRYETAAMIPDSSGEVTQDSAIEPSPPLRDQLRQPHEVAAMVAPQAPEHGCVL